MKLYETIHHRQANSAILEHLKPLKGLKKL